MVVGAIGQITSTVIAGAVAVKGMQIVGSSIKPRKKFKKKKGKFKLDKRFF